MRDKPRNTRTFHTVGETSQEGDNKLCTSKRDEERGTASFLFNNRTKLELWHLVDSVAFCGMERVFKGEGNIEREGGRRMDTGCLVRSVKQWWTVGDGKSIKNPLKKETKKKNLPKKEESQRERLSRESAETDSRHLLIQLLLTCTFIFLYAHTTGQRRIERRIERFGVSPIRHFLIFSFRWRILCFDTMNRLLFSFLFAFFFSCFLFFFLSHVG